MRIGITGANGFLGWHTRCRLKVEGAPSPILATRETFSSPASMLAFVAECDAIVHLAGINRANSESEIVSGNRDLAQMLADAIVADGRSLPLAYANSIKALEAGVYGEAKQAAADTLSEAVESTGGTFSDVLLPHLFGEFGVPFYNSGVTTFAYQLVAGERPEIQVDVILELVHAHEAARRLIEAVTHGQNGRIRVEGRPMRVSEALALLTAQYSRYVDDQTIPAFADLFEQQMFNMLRSQLVMAGQWEVPVAKHCDQRGFFSELIRADGLGQSSISASVAGISRGDHYHVDKVERFLVFSGQATIRIRRLFSDEIHSFDVSGDSPVAIDMPPYCTHSITNTGEGELLTFFWAADHFDPANPDTYPELVEKHVSEEAT